MSYLPALYSLMHYVSIRAILSLISTFLIASIIGKKFIVFSRQTFQNHARAFAPANHQIKGKTPTMGGVFILAASIMSMTIWADLGQIEPWILIITLLLFGFIGLFDDLCKVWYKKGVFPRFKFRMQIICSLLIALLWIWLQQPDPIIYLPFFKHQPLNLGLLFIPWIMFVLIASSNAVNLTDGLDGLATGILILNFAFFTLLAYCTDHAQLTIAGACLIGACAAFLRFNKHPAQIFMGDVGSLSLGAALAMMTIMMHQELLLPITGGIFVIETVSVMLQIFFIKKFGKKIWLMTPIHHHFEMLGWPENKITLRFYAVTLLLCFLAGIIVMFPFTFLM